MFSLTTTQLEAWANSIVQAVSVRGSQEDDRVEFKSAWIDPKKAARRIAGAANAARGADSIWIIGVDPRNAQPFTDPAPNELGQWLPAVKSCFVDAHTPVFRAFQVPVGDHTCFALAFDSEEAPFLIKNPSKGTQPTEVIEFEVPWREGTLVRSARRGELLSILYRRGPLPDFELLSASYGVESQKTANETKATGTIRLRIYIVPRSDDPVVLPLRRISWSIDHPKASEITLGDHHSYLDVDLKIGSTLRNSVIAQTSENRKSRVRSSEIILFGPELLNIVFQLSGSREVLSSIAAVSGRARFEVGADRIPITLHFETPPPISIPEGFTEVR